MAEADNSLLAKLADNLRRPVSAQLTIVCVAVLVFAWRGALWWHLAVAYLVAWLAVGLLSLRLARWSALLVAVIAVGSLYRSNVLDSESLGGLPHHLQDRWRLETVPSVSPGVVHGDRPQRFWVHAPHTSSVSLRLGSRGATLEAQSLGHGLFRADYDPRFDGRAATGEVTTATIITDGVRHQRELEHVDPTAHPRWFCRAPNGMHAATPSEETDSLVVVEPTGAIRSFDVGDGPSDCVFVSEREVLVAHRWGPRLWRLDVETGRVLAKTPMPSAHRLAWNGTRLAVAHRDHVRVLDQDLETLARISVTADWLAWSDETLVMSTLRPATLVRTSAQLGWEASDPLILGRPAVTMSSGVGGVVLAVTDYRPDGRPHVGNHFVQDQLLHVDAETWEVTRQFLTTRRSELQGSAGNIDRGVSPMGIEAHADGTLRVAFAGTDEAWHIGSGAEPSMEYVDAPAPHGIVSFATGSWSVSSPAAGTIATRTHSGWHVEALDDAGMTARRRGEQNFYESTRSGVSCQSCHLHGHTDFVLRNIGGFRLAPTLSVRGVAGTSPYLRDASYPRIRDLDHLSQTLLRGFLRRVERGPDIEAYVRSLARTRVEPAQDFERERRGADAFVRAQCPTCHAFPAFTNLAQIPLGTLFPERLDTLANDEVLDVPSLLSVSTHGPYLSDGRAESIGQVLRDHNPSNRHGDTQTLSEQELADLEYFLEAL